jgi:hypothetical protein
VIVAARRAGIPAYGHTWGDSARRGFTREAIAAGISGISHLMGLAPGAQPMETNLTPPDSAPDPWLWHKELWTTARPAWLDSVATEMIAANVWLEPTLSLEFYWGHPLSLPWEPRFFREPPRLREILGLNAPSAGPQPPAYPGSWQRQMRFVADFISRGGMVVAGTDGVRPGLDLHEEIRLIGEAAGSSMVGLQAATRNAAVALNRPDLGTIAAGQLADAVVYHVDPLRLPGATLGITAVLKAGVWHDAEQLAAEFEAEYDARASAAWRRRLARWLPVLGALAGTTLLLVLAIRRRRRPR